MGVYNGQTMSVFLVYKTAQSCSVKTVIKGSAEMSWEEKFDVASSRCSVTPTSYGTKQWNFMSLNYFINHCTYINL